MTEDDVNQRLNEVTELALGTATAVDEIKQMLGGTPPQPHTESPLDKPTKHEFAEPHYRDKSMLRSTSFQDTSIAEINNTVLSGKCKRSIKLIEKAWCDPVVFLSNNTDSKISKWLGGNMIGRKIERNLILLELAFLEARGCNYDALDSMDGDLPIIEGTIKSTVNFILSDTIGDKRIGMKQYPHISAEKERITEFGVPPQQEEQKKKGLFG